METFVKILCIILMMFALFFPLLPVKKRGKKGVTPIMSARYEMPDNKKNAFCILLAFAELILFIVLYNAISSLVSLVYSLPFIGNVVAAAERILGTKTEFIFFALFAFIVNVIAIYFYAIVKAILKKRVISPIFGIKEKKDKKKKDKKNVKTEKGEKGDKKEKSEETEEKEDGLTEGVEGEEGGSAVLRAEEEDEAKEEKKNFFAAIGRRISSLFFKAPDYKYAKNWVNR